MWNEIVKAIAKYESSVLSFVDAEGFPLSVRCVPQADGARQVIRVQLPPEVVAQPGPASLMSHHHDAQLWNLHGYSVVGELAREEGEGVGLAAAENHPRYGQQSPGQSAPHPRRPPCRPTVSR